MNFYQDFKNNDFIQLPSLLRLSPVELASKEPELTQHLTLKQKKIKILLYKNVKNSYALKCMIKNNENFNKNNGSGTVFINPKLILNVDQIYVSFFKTSLNFFNFENRFKSFEKELLFNLSGSNNIKETFNLFSINENTKEILKVQYCEEGELDKEHNDDFIIEGDPCDLEELPNYNDLKLIFKTYKIGKVQDENNLNLILSIILDTMALKGLQ
ncbi:hypothetical protein HDU92_005372 [Lobulomyces angularis]|nr:hypothetical protein HDU92_005372 [Lobulomyces angularis]